MLRSLTRDPGDGPADPAAVPPWTIFTQTLIHDFDLLGWLNPGARVVDVLATADALVAPEHKASGLLDSAVVVLRFDNGAIATAEACFAAAYGYDVRAEVLGSTGMVTTGDGARSSLRVHDRAGRRAPTSRSDVDLLADAYAAEFAELVAAVQERRPAAVTGEDARRAFAIAEACIASVRAGARVEVEHGDAV
jgi:myo-inositol 2-dehydrogenase/D-chiro-inositol 1-dehydrogenase